MLFQGTFVVGAKVISAAQLLVFTAGVILSSSTLEPPVYMDMIYRKHKYAILAGDPNMALCVD